VQINGVSYGPYRPTERIVAFGQDGNDDMVLVSSRIDGRDVFLTAPAILDAGAGNDKISAAGSRATNVLLGREGHDQLWGGDGFDLLIGGADQDQLYAAGAGDLLLGGSTVHDDNLAALAALAAEWGRADVPLEARKQHLLGAPGGLNGNYFLDAASLLDDRVVDHLFADPDIDWLLAAPADHVKGRKRK
jgi:Ca2+-binding RTX toxin-like protein